ncbi:hypothetical protein MRX96_057022 [Rhipicephalus microplus]
MGYPNTHIWMPSRSGGLWMLQLRRVALVTHYKALTRLVRLGDGFVDELFTDILGASRERITQIFGITTNLTEAAHVKMALKKRSIAWWKRQTDQYKNRDLFAHKAQFTANSWLAYDSKQLKDGDRIKALRLRTNLYPTRTLSKRHATNPVPAGLAGDVGSRIQRRVREIEVELSRFLSDLVNKALVPARNFVTSRLFELAAF